MLKGMDCQNTIKAGCYNILVSGLLSWQSLLPFTLFFAGMKMPKHTLLCYEGKTAHTATCVFLFDRIIEDVHQ